MGVVIDQRTEKRTGNVPSELISDRVLSVWGLTPSGRVTVGKVQRKPQWETVRDQVTVGCRVCIVTPDNPKLHNTLGTVLEIEEWGCHLDAPAAESGRFRALWSEMVVV